MSKVRISFTVECSENVAEVLDKLDQNPDWINGLIMALIVGEVLPDNVDIYEIKTAQIIGERMPV